MTLGSQWQQRQWGRTGGPVIVGVTRSESICGPAVVLAPPLAVLIRSSRCANVIWQTFKTCPSSKEQLPCHNEEMNNDRQRLSGQNICFPEFMSTA
eukprot:2349811-Pyramimonas_sp.AAC.1